MAHAVLASFSTTCSFLQSFLADTLDSTGEATAEASEPLNVRNEIHYCVGLALQTTKYDAWLIPVVGE